MTLKIEYLPLGKLLRYAKNSRIGMVMLLR